MTAVEVADIDFQSVSLVRLRASSFFSNPSTASVARPFDNLVGGGSDQIFPNAVRALRNASCVPPHQSSKLHTLHPESEKSVTD